MAKPKGPAGHAPRGDRRVQEHDQDTYKIKGKLKEPTACPQCGAVYQKGRWTWYPRPVNAMEVLCPACNRINDDYPKGLLTLKGRFLAEHRDELFGLIRNEESGEKAERPLSRIMKIDERGDAVMISMTETHLVRRIGNALHNAYEGDLSFDQGEDFVRAGWTRED